MNELVLNEEKTVTVLFGLKEKSNLLLDFQHGLVVILDQTLCWSQLYFPLTKFKQKYFRSKKTFW